MVKNALGRLRDDFTELQLMYDRLEEKFHIALAVIAGAMLILVPFLIYQTRSGNEKKKEE